MKKIYLFLFYVLILTPSVFGAIETKPVTDYHAVTVKKAESKKMTKNQLVFAAIAAIATGGALGALLTKAYLVALICGVVGLVFALLLLFSTSQ